MRRLRHGIAALLLALLVLPAFALADDKDKKDPAPDAKKDADKKDEPNSAKTISAGTVSGKIVEVNETGKSLKLEVSYAISVPNVGEMQALASCEAQLQQAIARRDRNAIANLYQQMAIHSANSMTQQLRTKNVDVTSADDVQVRRENPAPVYDDKGNPKKLTAKELKELKGDSKLVGYPAQFSDLHQGDYVKVSLVKVKESKESKESPAASKPKEGSKAKDADPETRLDNLPEASLILLVGGGVEMKK